MSVESKRYAVQYDIQADTTAATTSLTKLQEFAGKINQSFAQAPESIKELNKAVSAIRDLNIKAPTLDLAPYRIALNTLKTEVLEAATQMQIALQEVFNPKNPRSVRKNFLESELASTKEAIKNTQKAIEKITQDKGISTEKRQGTLPSGRKIEFFGRGTYAQAAEAERANMDRALEEHYKNLDHYQKEVDRINKAIAKNKVENSKGVVEESSLTNPRVVKGITEDLKKAVTDIKNKLPKVPLQFDLDLGSLRDQLGEVTNKAYDVTITPVLDNNAIGKLRSQLQNLSNTAKNSTDNAVKKTAEEVQQNTTLSKPAPSTPKGNPLTAEESSRLAQLKRNGALQNLEDAKRKLINAKRKLIPDKPKTQENYNDALNSYKQALNEARPIQEEITALEKKSFQSSSMRVLSDHELTQGSRWVNAVDRLKKMKEQASGPRLQKINKAIDTGEERINALLRPRNIAPTMSEAEIMISVGLNSGPALSDLSRLEQFIREQTVTLNIKAINETAQIKDQVKKIVKTGKNKTTTIEGAHIPIPVVLDSSTVAPQLKTIISDNNNQKITIKGTLKFVDVTSQINKALRDAHAAVEKGLLSRANKYAEIINNGGTLPVQKKAKQTVADLRDTLKQSLASIPKALTTLLVRAELHPEGTLGVQNQLNEHKFYIFVKPVFEGTDIKLLEEQERLAQSKNSKGKKKAPVTERPVPPTVTQTISDIHKNIKEGVTKVAENLTEVKVNARLDYSNIWSQLGSLQNAVNVKPIYLPIEPFLRTQPTFKEQLVRKMSSPIVQPPLALDKSLLSFPPNIKEQIGANPKNAEQLVNLGITLNTASASATFKSFIEQIEKAKGTVLLILNIARALNAFADFINLISNKQVSVLITLNIARALNAFTDFINIISNKQVSVLIILNIARALNAFSDYIELISNKKVSALLLLNIAKALNAFNDFIELTSGKKVSAELTLDFSLANSQLLSFIDSVKEILAQPIPINIQPSKAAPNQNEEKTTAITQTGQGSAPKNQQSAQGTNSNQTSAVNSAQNVKNAATSAAGTTVSQPVPPTNTPTPTKTTETATPTSHSNTTLTPRAQEQFIRVISGNAEAGKPLNEQQVKVDLNIENALRKLEELTGKISSLSNQKIKVSVTTTGLNESKPSKMPAGTSMSGGYTPKMSLASVPENLNYTNTIPYPENTLYMGNGNLVSSGSKALQDRYYTSKTSAVSNGAVSLRGVPNEAFPMGYYEGVGGSTMLSNYFPSPTTTGGTTIGNGPAQNYTVSGNKFMRQSVPYLKDIDTDNPKAVRQWYTGSTTPASNYVGSTISAPYEPFPVSPTVTSIPFNADDSNTSALNQVQRQLENHERVLHSIGQKQQKFIDFDKRVQELVGDNGKLVNFVHQNRSSFLAASREIGFTPYATSTSAKKAAYLEEVMKQLEKDGVSTPTELKNRYKQLSAIAEMKRLRAERAKAADAVTSRMFGHRVNIKNEGLSTQEGFFKELLGEYNRRGIPTKRLLKHYEQIKTKAQIEERDNQLARIQNDEQQRRIRFTNKIKGLLGNDGKLIKFALDNQQTFMDVSRRFGFTPNERTFTSRKAKYLEEVLSQLREKGVTVPTQLQNLYNEFDTKAKANRIKKQRKLAIREVRRQTGIGTARLIDLPITKQINFIESLMREFNRRNVPVNKNLTALWKSALAEREQAKRARIQSSIANRQQKATQIRQGFLDRILPLVGNDKNLANFVLGNYKHFTSAAQSLGFTPTANMSHMDRAIYLDEVMRSLNSKGIEAPSQLKAAYNKSNGIIEAQRLRTEAVKATKILTGTISTGFNTLSVTAQKEFVNTLIGEFRERGLKIPKGLANLQAKTINKYNAKQQEVAANWAAAEQARAQQRTAAEQARLQQEASDRVFREAHTQARNATRINSARALQEATASQRLKYYENVERVYAENNAQMRSATVANYQRAKEDVAKLEAKKMSRIKNMVAPVAPGTEMRNMIANNWESFRKAAIDNHVKTVEAYTRLNNEAKLKFLKDVRANIARTGTVPAALDKEITNLATKLGATPPAGGSGSGTVPPSGTSGKGRTPYEKPLYDRARKWAYPFSGQTSFGVRTPMMVDMAKGMGVMFAIGGAMSAIGDSFSQAMEYQNTMETTKAILQHGTDTFGTTNYRNMEHIIRDVGIKTKFSAPEVANAARFLAMAGYNIEDINNSIRPIADIALIGDTDLGETADKVTNIMTTFGIDSNRMREIANILTTTATRSNTDIMMLAEAAKYGGGVAHMYGANDPNLFADTMALFGVMGNAGIQGSSAGTGLRMMYQNIFNPNKKQKAILKELEKKGIKTKNADGSFVSMAQFVRDVATKITDPKELAAVVGSLFRITAQPAANAAIMAAVGGDTDALKDTLDKFQEIEKSLLEKGGLSKLADLMEANHRAINGNISGDVAEKKQNTIQGLLAQVTSTFTEGIVKAFESRQGGFEGMLKSIRDFLAQPQIATMLRNLLDLIVEIGKIMGTFVKIWADFYHSFPGAIKLWMTLQMVFTQFGYLLSPFVALLGVANRIGGTIMKFTGGGLALKLGGGAAAASSGLTNSALLLSGSTLFSTAKKRPLPNQARIASNMLSSNMLLNGVTMAQNYPFWPFRNSEIGNYGRNPLPPLSPTPLAASITPGTSLMAATAMAGVAPNAEIEKHNKAVRARAWRMYGLPKAVHTILAPWSKKSFASFWSMLSAIFSGIGKILLGIVNSLASVLALLINPITLLIGGITGVVYGVWKINQLFNGQSEAQIQAFENTKQLADQARFEREKNSQWLAGLMKNKDSDFYKEHGNGLVGSVALSKKGETTLRYEAMMEARKKNYPELFKDKLTNNVSHRRTVMAAEEWRNSLMDDTLSRLALGDNYLKNTKDTLNPTRDTTFTGKYAGLLGLGAQLYYILYGDKKNAEMVEQQRALDFVKVEAANDSRVKQAVEEAEKIYTQYINKKIKEDEYKAQIQAIKNKYIPKNIESARSATSLNLAPQELLEYGDIASLREYQEGLANVINAALDPEHSGSPFAYANAVIKLASNAVQEGTTDWMKYIGDIINNSELKSTINLFSGEVVDWALKLRALPNGNVDVDFVIRQIQDKVKSYKKNLQDVATISASVYKLLADNGFLTANAEGARKYVSDQLGNKVGESMASAYYDKYLAIGGNFLGTKDQFMKWLFGTEEEKSKTFKSSKTGNILSRNGTLRKILETTINDTVKDTFGADFLNGTSEEGTKSKDSGKGDKNPTTNLLSSLDHSDYASGYEKVNKVSQVHMAFNAPLVQFSDTAISSSAEERDIMMAIEEKCANVVLMAVTSAMSQATQTYDA